MHNVGVGGLRIGPKILAIAHGVCIVLYANKVDCRFVVPSQHHSIVASRVSFGVLAFGQSSKAGNVGWHKNTKAKKKKVRKKRK
jgi:hypothetical protein